MELKWDVLAERKYETGVDHCVLYVPDAAGAYTTGVAWNGITTITESPSGAESTKQYADNIVYLNLQSEEQFGATLEAFMYPDEFAPFDGSPAAAPGVYIGQQRRGFFGLSYRSLVGNAVEGTDFGYKLHLVYGAQAGPSEKARGTVNESPEAMNMSWELTTTPVPVGDIDGKFYRPTAHLSIDSTTADTDALATLEGLLYGTDGTPGANPTLPDPATVIAMFATP